MFELSMIPGVKSVLSLASSVAGFFRGKGSTRPGNKTAKGAVTAKRGGIAVGHFAQFNIRSGGDRPYGRNAGSDIRQALRAPIQTLSWQEDDALKCFEHWNLRPGVKIKRRGLVDAWHRIVPGSDEEDFFVGLAGLIERGFVRNFPEYFDAVALTEQGYEAIR